MSEKHKTLISFIGAFAIAVVCLGSWQSRADTVGVNVFEQFRNEMAIDYNRAGGKFMDPGALAKWNAGITQYFSVKRKQINHFFAYSLMIPKIKGDDLFMVFFNPWVDGALFTQWKETNKIWKMTDFYMASGERIRGRITPKSVITTSQLPPIWLWQKGTLSRNIFAYYKYMRNWLLAKPVDDYILWFRLSKAEAAADLLRVKLRMGARQRTTTDYINNSTGGPALSSAISRLKNDALAGNKKGLKAYSRHGGIIADLRPEIVKTLYANWIFHKKGVYTTILSSSVAPRFFLFMNTTDNGKIQDVLFGDLEAMATMPRTAAAPARPARPALTTRKVQRYKDANGDRIEIVTENRGGKVTMTMRKNGKVTEVINF